MAESLDGRDAVLGFECEHFLHEVNAVLIEFTNESGIEVDLVFLEYFGDSGILSWTEGNGVLLVDSR